MSLATPAKRRVELEYRPREHQAQIHDRLKRFSVLVCHRRFGKTVLCINSLVAAGLRCKRPDPRFAYVAPLLTQARDIAWTYLKRYALVIPGATANETESRVDLPGGARVRLYGADNPDRLRGGYFDGVVLDEYADMDPRVWSTVIRPALSDRGGWAIFIGTPKGRNDLHRLYEQAKGDPAWYAGMFRASETGVVAADELASAARDMTAEEYAQEYECSFEAAIKGAYYGKELAQAERDGRLTSVPHEPRSQVWTAWDLGIGDATAIWFCQQVGNEVRIIDYVENAGVGLAWYAAEVHERRQRGWVFAEHLLPHDAEARELGTGKTRVETLKGLGISGKVLPAQSVDDGINAARLLLPRCWFDAKRCERGLEALRQYRTEWDEKLKTFRDHPRHDWTSHAADAFRYLAMGLKPASKPKPAGERNHGPGGWLG